MNFYVIVNKKIKELAVGDIIFEDIGRLTRGVRLVNAELKQSLQKRKPFSIRTLQSLDNQPVCLEKVKEYLLKREETQDMGFSAIKEDIFSRIREIYAPFSEEDESFTNPKRRKHITLGALFNPFPSDLFEADIEAGSQSILPTYKIKALMESLTSAYHFFNGFKRKSEETKGEKRTFSRQNYSSTRLPTIYHPVQNKIEILGDEIAWHAVDTALYFMATLTNLNKIRHAQGKPLSNLRFLVEGEVDGQGEYCYQSPFILGATLGALLAPLGYMHRSLLSAIYAKNKNLKEKDIELLKKASIATFNLVRTRDDIPAITKLIISKQNSLPNSKGESALKEGEILHEFVRLYHVVRNYDYLVNPFVLPSPISQQEAIEWLCQESSPYDPEANATTLKRFDQTMLEAFLNILAPYKNSELVYLVHQDDKKKPLYKGFVLNYNNDSVTPLIGVLHDYQNCKNYLPGEIIFDLTNGKVFVLKDEKIIKQVKSVALKGLKIYNLDLEPIDLITVERFF